MGDASSPLNRGRFYPFDLASKKVLWARAGLRRKYSIGYSPSGDGILVVEPDPKKLRAVATVLRMRDGSVLFKKSLHLGKAKGSEPEVKNLTTSDDGRWVVLVLNSDNLRIYDMRSGSLSYQERLSHSDFEVVAFEPKKARLAISTLGGGGEGKVRVLQRVEGAWRDTSSFEPAFWPDWTRPGLVMETLNGIELWDGKKRRVLLKAQKIFLSNERPLEAYPLWRCSKDADYCATWERPHFHLVLWQIKTHRQVFTYGEGIALDRLVDELAFGPRNLRAFLKTGELIDVDLRTHKIVRRQSFGAPGEYKRNWLHEGASWTRYYSARLSPKGKYLSIKPKSKNRRIYTLE